MKLKFRNQPYQAEAVSSVTDCFMGQPKEDGLSYRIDRGKNAQASTFGDGVGNASLVLDEARILHNIQQVQRRQNLPVSQSLTDFTTVNGHGETVPVSAAYQKHALAATRIHLDVEMETGTGKTYCYIKTIFEMNKLYGWSKFIIMVPSIAIREGVCKTLGITADHFAESYGKKARFFIYNSKRLHELESFSSDAGINVMVINIQGFNSRSMDNLRIYEKLDDFQSRRPIDVIAANRPILILDEPQKMGGATQEALPKFHPLMVLRYSATHKTQHKRVYRLDALDAYNQKLVKRIAVRGIQTRGLAGTSAYLYLEGIDISQKTPMARIELEVKLKSGEIRRQFQRRKCRDDLFKASGGLEQYRGFTISEVDYNTNTIEFTNGIALKSGEANGDVSDSDIRRIQIRETIRTHLDKEKQLFSQGIKVLSLFFIDEVAKYRDYDRPDEKGEYARIFEEQYALLKDDYLTGLPIDNVAYRDYLAGLSASRTHNGYFAMDRKTHRFRNPHVGARSTDSDDADAYDLILKDKERLLSFAEPTRFIFSHSALREGWDNPNIFVMCMLKHASSAISRRQEVGRGLRLSVDQHGERMNNPLTVHDINVLTVIASESYRDFVAGLQKEITETLSSRPQEASQDYFTGKLLFTDTNNVEITADMAKQIHNYLIKSDYIDENDRISSIYHQARSAGTLSALPAKLAPYADQIFELIDNIFTDGQFPRPEDGRRDRTNPLNANFKKKEFQELWSRINRKAIYRVEFDSDELVRKSIDALNRDLRVTPLQYTVQVGLQKENLTHGELHGGTGFSATGTRTEQGGSIHSLVKYDLIGKVAESVQLTRETIARILSQLEPVIFRQFTINPEHFISEASRLIAEQKATMVIEHLTYDATRARYDTDIFTAAQMGQDFSRVSSKLRKHIYDYAITDSQIEAEFVRELDISEEVAVYAKLPRGFQIPTPVGDYNPDWAISFKSGDVRHIYFIAETKGSMSSMKLREIENAKIECARKFFRKIGKNIRKDEIRYDVVTDYSQLMDIVSSMKQD
ncbi:type III restriction-modification system endonuclease [Novacetimonas pomaceti]|uniref:Restriction endonuclease subunit R n=1 Tax=Novacetimonas pomaceti TaxID=2021998 RepID=A0ABX5P366_9PROT|nr:DEAD/DEAH box helicase family protein [Novacetimonas pomaceti]PYD46726.1 restriction endonuclease subunit R [Novacetimonas pomaceti]